MRVLVTGAGGFIGQHLVTEQLRRGWEVTAIDLQTEALEPLRGNSHLEIVRIDFTNADAIRALLPGHEICFHLASAHLEQGVSDTYFWDVNVHGTRALVESCRQAGIGRFVHCSSVGVYGDIKEPPADEQSPCHPDIAYEQSKLAGEDAVLSFAHETGYEVVIVRPAWVYGPGCPRTERLFRTVNKGRFFYVGSGKTLRHPIYIDDMVAGFIKAASHDLAVGEIFIMAGPRAVTIRELVDSIALIEGVSRPNIQLPKLLVWPAVYALEVAGAVLGRSVPFTRRSLKFFTGNTAFRTVKAEKLLDYRAEIDLKEGLQETYRWLVDNSLL